MMVFLGESPMKLKFLNDRDEHTSYGLKRLIAPRNYRWNEDHVKEAKRDTKTWLWFGLIFFARYVPFNL